MISVASNLWENEKIWDNCQVHISNIVNDRDRGPLKRFLSTKLLLLKFPGLVCATAKPQEYVVSKSAGLSIYVLIKN